MNKIKNIFKERKNINIAYIVGGFPNLEYTKEFILNLKNSAIDILEIGIPYSDPLADGRIISEASFTASQNNINPDTIFELLIAEKENIDTPLVFLVYYNLIFSYGIEKFIEKSLQAGISGFIVPDLPYEEAEEFSGLLRKNNISFIPLVSVTSEKRISKLVSRGSGFVYAVASLGVTGSKQVPLERLKKFIDSIKENTDLPVAVGFGVRSKEDAAKLRNISDGLIIGTSIVKLTEEYDPVEVISRLPALFSI